MGIGVIWVNTITDMPDNIHDIAISYFNGTITKEEEMLLEAFVNADEENSKTFRQWEAEWAQANTMSVKAQQAYSRFAYQKQLLLAKQAHPRKLWKRVAAAAAIVVLMAGSALTAWQLSKSAPETYYTCTVPYGSKTCMELPDGSVVWLNAGSKLRYSSRFNEDNRRVELQGEGYFDVKKNNGKTFVVKTPACDVTVKGTRFDVSAYNDDALTAVYLMEGSVQVNSSVHQATLTPGQKVTVDKLSGRMQKSVHTGAANTWIDNNLDFESITLAELTKILARQFNVNFVIESKRLAKIRFSVLLKQKETITDVMQSLQTIQPMTIVKKDRNIYISD